MLLCKAIDLLRPIFWGAREGKPGGLGRASEIPEIPNQWIQVTCRFGDLYVVCLESRIRQGKKKKSVKDYTVRSMDNGG